MSTLKLKKPLGALRQPLGRQSFTQDEITAISHYNAKWQRSFKVRDFHGRVYYVKDGKVRPLP